MFTNTSGTCSLPIHPGTGLRAIGMSRRGPIWPILGGSGEGEGAPAPDPAATAGAPDAPPASPTPPAEPAADPKAGLTDLDAANAEIARLRRENASDRTAGKTKAADDARNELAQSIGKALGIIKDDEAADPAKLAQQLAERDTDARSAKVELAVYKAAGAAGADPDALLDSRAFLNALTGIDPDDAAAVTAAIAEAIKTNPKLKAGQTPGASGVDHSGGSGEQRNRTPMSLTQAAAAHYGT